jgi:hypothetical protein
VRAMWILLAFCCFAVMLVPVAMFVFTYVFRQACSLSGLPKPSVITATGVMLLIRVSTTTCEALMDLIVRESCNTAGLSHWESRIIVFFLLLPIDLLISAGLHSGLMNIKFGKGIEVWFVQWLIILSIVAAITFVVGIIILVYQLN